MSSILYAACIVVIGLVIYWDTRHAKTGLHGETTGLFGYKNTAPDLAEAGEEKPQKRGRRTIRKSARDKAPRRKLADHKRNRRG